MRGRAGGSAEGGGSEAVPSRMYLDRNISDVKAAAVEDEEAEEEDTFCDVESHEGNEDEEGGEEAEEHGP